MVHLIRQLRSKLILGLALGSLGWQAAAAYPEKPVRIVVPFSVGGGTDITGRMLAEELGKKFGNSFFVENRDGAAGVIGVQAVAKSPPDGYTLLIAGNSLFTSHKTLYPNLQYDPSRDFVPIASVASGSHILVVKPGSPYRNVADLIRAAQANPGKITYGSGGKGSTVHLAAEMFQLMSNTKLMHVPYRGTSLAVTGLLAGDTDLMFDTTASSIPRLKSGQLRALGLTSLKRDAQIPDVPTVAEQGLPKYEVLFWLGLYAPKGTPAAVVDKIEDAVKDILQQENFNKRLAEQGMSAFFESSPDLARRITRETAQWAGVIQKSGVRMD